VAKGSRRSPYLIHGEDPYRARLRAAELVASLTSLRVSIVSGGILCVAGTLVIAALLPAFIRYDAREAADAAPA